MGILGEPPIPMAAFPGRSLISSTNCGAPSDFPADERPPYTDRLYGRKRGRPLRPAQQVLLERSLPQLAIELPPSGEVDPRRLFASPVQSIWLEIGFGGGEHLATQAKTHPDFGFIGCEVFENGIAKLLGDIARCQLTNIRLFADDARRLIAALAPASIGRVFILFPDPWPKVRQHKRRIVSCAPLDGLAEIMADNAELRLATDDSGYLCWMLEHLTAHPAFEWLARRPGDWRERPPDWPPTRYEEKARAAARSPAFLRMSRRPRNTN